MGDTNQPQSIKQVIQKMTKTNDGAVIEATVISASPLKVKATNDDKLVLSASTLIVPRHLTDYTAGITVSLGGGSISSDTDNVTHSHEGGEHAGHVSGDGEHSHNGGGHSHRLVSFALSGGTMTVHNALKVGDIVYLLPYNGGKKYYILDRRG